MKTIHAIPTILAAAITGLFPLAPAAVAQFNSGAPKEVRDLDIVEKPGSRLPLDVELVDSSGKVVRLGEYFEGGSRSSGKPVILSLAYYDCPVACPMMFANMLQCFNALDFTLGVDYQVVTVSFDPTNTTSEAAEWKQAAVQGYSRRASPAIRDGWEIHTTTDENARAIADSVGFQYRYFPETGEYGHPSGIFVLTPDGRLSRALYGAGWEPRQVKLALLDASSGEIAKSFGDHLLQWCYKWDPSTGTYSASAFFMMQVVAVITAGSLALLVVALRLGERKRAARQRMVVQQA